MLQPVGRKSSSSKPPVADGQHRVRWTPAGPGFAATIVSHTDGLQRTIGNRTVGLLLTTPGANHTKAIRRIPQLPAAAAGSGVIGADPAAGLGQDYDAFLHPVDVISGGGTPSKGLPTAFERLQGLWMKDIFTSLQILRINGSPGAPRSRAPFDWLVNNRTAALPRIRLALTAISNPTLIVEGDYAGLPDDQVREVRAFIGLRNWDDPVAGLPRANGPGAGALTAAQTDQIEYVRRRRAAATVKSGMLGSGPGHMYMGSPTTDPLPAGSTAGSLDAAIWTELNGEGSASAINTYDDQKLTWGKGWSAKSTLPGIVQGFFAADDGARNELMEAGFTYSNGRWMFVSIARNCVLEGEEALTGLQGDVKFASLLAHLSEDPTHQQNMVNAQWTALRSGGRAGDIPAAIRTTWPTVWSTAAVRFGAHCVHWGFAWSQVQAVGPSLSGLLRWISTTKGKARDGAVVVNGWASRTIRSFADGAGEHLMQGPAALPTPLATGTFYFQQEGEANQNRYYSWHP